jgi:hypothetical protein
VSVVGSSVGPCCFGIVVGFLTYRTLIRSGSSSISDLAAIVAAIGGGAVTGAFLEDNNAFGWYAIGLLAGVIGYWLAFLVLNGRKATGKVMGDADERLLRPR